MQQRTATRLAWLLFGASLLMAGFAVALNLSQPYDADLGTTTGEIVLGGLMLIIFAWFGALIVSRRPGHPIGWISCALGVCLGVGGLGSEYAILGLVSSPGAVPGAAGAAWFTSWMYAVELGLLVALLILFPTGEPASRRWQLVLWVAGVATILSIIAAISVWPSRGISMLQVQGDELVAGPFRILYGAGFSALLASVVAGAASLVARFRRADDTQRPQIKLFLSAMIAAIAGVVIMFAIGSLRNTSEVVADVLVGLPITLIPISMGLAILRFRLYDIDRLISRTVAYLVLTVVVTAVYASVVVAAGQLLGDATTRTPAWAVASATLAAAAIVQPARHRIQKTVDRRFNRRKYDADKTVDAFSAQLRDELELDALTAQLHVVIAETLQPTTSFLWLR